MARTCCPKCGDSRLIGPRFIKGTDTGEWLKYRCWKCGYEHMERPKDNELQEQTRQPSLSPEALPKGEG